MNCGGAPFSSLVCVIVVVASIFTLPQLVHSQCSAEDVRNITVCGSPLNEAQLHGMVDYVIAANPRQYSLAVFCELFKKFHTCADGSLHRCIESDIRFEAMLLSAEAWASLCSTNQNEAMLTMKCLSDLHKSDKLKTCREQTEADVRSLQSIFTRSDATVCNMFDRHLSCLREPVSTSCSMDIFFNLSKAYKSPADFFLKTCRVPVLMNDYASSATKSYANAFNSLMSASIMVAILVIHSSIVFE